MTLTAITSADLPAKLRVEGGAGRPTVHLFAQDNLALAVLVQENLVEDLSNVDVLGGVGASMVPEKFDGKQYFLPFRPTSASPTSTTSGSGARTPGRRRPSRSSGTSPARLRDAGGAPKVTLSLAQGDPAAVTISEWIVSYGGTH